MDSTAHDRIISYLPLARAAANRCRQRQFREDVYQACCLRIVEVVTGWDGPREHEESRIRKDLKDIAWAELGFCLRPFGHPKDHRQAHRVLAVTPTEVDFNQALDKGGDEDARDIRQVVGAVVSSQPQEERAFWLELLLSGSQRRLVARKHGFPERWMWRRLWEVKARLRTALERAGFAA